MDRYIVHIDLDFFYGQVEVALNPSLGSLPFAIQQKHIVVTCNYLARKAGVKKLQLLTDAKKLCPNLIIVLGEDIQKYRDASKAIFRHVRSLLGDKVQRLGMDELWCDVTDHVLRHETLYPQGWQGFQSMALNGDNVFKFDPGIGSGHVLGSDLDTTTHRRLKVASHLAAFIRESIYNTFTYTSSGGISSSKLIAKLVGDCHKPDAQTLIFPEQHQEFLDSVKVKKIAGVGYVFLKTLYDKISSEPAPAKRSVELPLSTDITPPVTETAPTVSVHDKCTGSYESEIKVSVEEQEDEGNEDDGDEFKLISKQKEEFLNEQKRKLTVLQVRTIATRVDLIDWFGKEKGIWLHDVLHARDSSLVEPSALYPKSIGVEDSFLHCTEVKDVQSRLLDLTTDLIRRMEGDLMENDRWVRWPSSLKLTPRFRGVNVRGELWRHKRTSRSVPLPVDIFNTTISVDQRANELVNSILMPLFSKIAVDRGNWDLSLLNVGVADFKVNSPALGISEYMKNAIRKRKQLALTNLDECPEGLDTEVWSALDDITKEHVLRDRTAQDYENQPGTQAAGKRVRSHGEDLTEPEPSVAHDGAEGLDYEWPDVEEDDLGYLCHKCQSVIPSFAIESHEPCNSRV